MLAGCSESVPSQHPVSDAIGQALRANPDTTIDLRTLTPFRWSRVHVFRPYVMEAEVERALGLEPIPIDS